MEESTFRTALVGRVLLARAVGSLTVAGLTVVLREVAAARKQAGEPLLYWPILDPTSDPPAPEVRAKMNDATDSLLRYCESMTIIIPGQGLKVSLLRTFMRGMVRFGAHADRVRITDSLAAAAASAAATDPRINFPDLEQAAKAAGIEIGTNAASSLTG